MATKTLANLRDALSTELHDYLHSTVTTALAATNNLVDTELANVKGGTVDNFCKGWWVLVTSENNDGEIRRVSSYTATSKTIVSLGAAWTAETAGAKATYELHKYHPTDKLDAINIVAQDIYPDLYREVVDTSLITGNILPDFNWWTAAAAHLFWSSSTMTLARTSPGSGYTRGNRFSMKTTDAGAGDEYVLINSDDYPRLLDLQGHSVSFYVWAYPVDTDDDAEIEIYTVKPTTTGTTVQTLTSTTVSEKGTFNLIKLETQAIASDIDFIEIRMRCVTASKNVYFAEPRLVVDGINSYMLPEWFQEGDISWVGIQRTGRSYPCDNVGSNDAYDDYYGCHVVTEDVNGTVYKFLETPDFLSSQRRIELKGRCPLEYALSADTDTVTLDNRNLRYFVLASARQLFIMERGSVTSETSDVFEKEIARIDYQLLRLGNLKMTAPSAQMRVRY